MQNRRVIISDSESDLDDDSDELNDNANLAKQSSNQLGSKTKPSNNAVSESFSDDNLDNVGDTSTRSNDDNSNDDDLEDAVSKPGKSMPSATANKRKSSSDDDLGDVSGRSSNDTFSATSNPKESSRRNPIIRSNKHMSSSIERPKTVKRKADNMFDPRNIISNQSISSQNNGERQEQRRVTRRKKVSYDMKHHPMDDILRSKFSAKRRANGQRVSKDSSNNNAEIDEDITSTFGDEKIIKSSSLRRSSRKINQSVTLIYNGEWHPLDQMLRDNATLTNKRNKMSHKSFNNSLSTLKDEEGSKTANADLDSDLDVVKIPDSKDETASMNPDIRRFARVSTSQKQPPNYDMKYISNQIAENQ